LAAAWPHWRTPAYFRLCFDIDGSAADAATARLEAASPFNLLEIPVAHVFRISPSLLLPASGSTAFHTSAATLPLYLYYRRPRLYRLQDSVCPFGFPRRSSPVNVGGQVASLLARVEISFEIAQQHLASPTDALSVPRQSRMKSDLRGHEDTSRTHTSPFLF